MSQSHRAKDGTTDDAFQEQCFLWERGASVGLGEKHSRTPVRKICERSNKCNSLPPPAFYNSIQCLSRIAKTRPFFLHFQPQFQGFLLTFLSKVPLNCKLQKQETTKFIKA